MDNAQAQPAGLFTGKAVHATRAFPLSGPMPKLEEPAVDSPPITDTPANQVEPAPAAPQPEGLPDDLAKIKEELETERKRRMDLQSYKDKELNILKSQLEATQNLLKEKETQLVEATSVKRQAPLSDEEFEELAQTFPNIDSIAHVRAMKIVEEELAPLRREIEQLRNERKQSAEEKAKEQLRKLHPDFEQLQTDPDFISWYQSQPKKIQDLITSETSTVAEIARGLDFYKKDKGIKSKKEKEFEASLAVQVDAPVKPEANKPKMWTYSELKAETARLNKLPTSQARPKLDEIDAAVREGRVDFSR